MQITREADYAIRIALELASSEDGASLATAVICQRRLIPQPLARKLVQRLVAAGLVRSARGARGGLVLARPADEIDLLAVIQAVEGPPSVNRCVLNPHVCPLQPTCPVHEVCREAHADLIRRFQGATLRSLANRGHALRAGTGPPPAARPSPSV